MVHKTAIVVGGGIAGLACARVLAIGGYHVKVFERSERAVGASIRNFGMIWPIGQPDGNYEIACRSRDIWKQMGDEGAFSIKQSGSLHVAHREDEWNVLREVYNRYEQTRPVSLLDRDEVFRISNAAYGDSLIGGLFSRDECIVDPRLAIAGVTSYLREKLNVEFHFGKHVKEISSGSLSTADGARYDADIIVVCSGAELESLYPQIFSQYAITKCKLQMMRFDVQPNWDLGPSLCGGLSLIHYKSFAVANGLVALRERYERDMPEYIKYGIHVMVSQNASGELTVGDSHEYGQTHDPFDRSDINDLILDYLQSFAKFKNNWIVQTWNGVYAKLTDGSSYLFTSPEPGVYLFNGLGGNGMTLSFGLAEKLLSSELSIVIHEKAPH
jgi:FAD dependent oxidoreductase TIGR03364